MMKILCFVCLLLLLGCAAKQQPPAPVPVAPTPAPAPAPVAAAPKPIRSEMPPPTAEIIVHCVVTQQENANTVSCACSPVTTKIDSKTGHTEIICKKTKLEK